MLSTTPAKQSSNSDALLCMAMFSVMFLRFFFKTEISEVSIYNDEFRYKSLRFYIDSHCCIRNVGLVVAITSNLDTKKKKIILLLSFSSFFFHFIIIEIILSFLLKLFLLKL